MLGVTTGCVWTPTETFFLMRWHVERGESQGRISHHVVAQWSGGDVFVYVREITEVSEDVKRTHGKVQ